MENNIYYVHKEGNKLYGPYTFRDAIKEQNYCIKFGVKSIILKKVVDDNGKEVK